MPEMILRNGLSAILWFLKSCKKFVRDKSYDLQMGAFKSAEKVIVTNKGYQAI